MTLNFKVKGQSHRVNALQTAYFAIYQSSGVDFNKMYTYKMEYGKQNVTITFKVRERDQNANLLET